MGSYVSYVINHIFTFCIQVMAAIHKISEDFFEDSYTLIALHSSLEDHALVYALNTCLKSKLRRSREDLDISKEVSFPIFEWKDIVHDANWTLITNFSIKEENLGQDGLFGNEPSYRTYYLVPEHRDVDYFLKIEMDDVDDCEPIVRGILKIPEIITAYTVDNKKLKSKNNLIF